MDRQILLAVGPLIRQEQHPNNCLSQRTPTDQLELFLFRSAIPHDNVPRRHLLLLQEPDRAEHLHHHVRHDQHLLRWCHGPFDARSGAGNVHPLRHRNQLSSCHVHEEY